MATNRPQPQRASRRSAAAARAARGLGRSKMFGPLTYDGVMRLARCERASPRHETPNRAEMDWSLQVVDLENARVDDDVDREEAFRDFERRDQELLTLERALKMSGSAPNAAYQCRSERHALEIQRPGCIAQQRGKLRALTQNRKANDRVCMTLCVLNGSVSRGRFKRKGGVPHSFVYVQAFMEIDAVLLEKNACISSRMGNQVHEFVYGATGKKPHQNVNKARIFSRLSKQKLRKHQTKTRLRRKICRYFPGDRSSLTQRDDA